jgi:ABC-type bacteriocin/lantibiotic exporter with double-glycine peptidase domain
VRAQRKGYWCGIASIANALEVLGIRRTQREIAKLCDVNEAAGTDETEMKRALLANGVGVDEWHRDDAFASESWVLRHIVYRGPTILCVDNDEHWVTVIGVCAGQFTVFDPSRNTGIEIHSAESLTERWVNSDGIYYGIGVSKP